MTDQPRTPDSEGTGPSSEPQAAGASPEGMPAGSDFSSGEGMVALAGLILLAVWIVFDLLIDNYGFDNSIAVVAAAAAIVPRVNRQTVEKVAPLPVIMKVLGWALVLFGIIEVVLDIRFGVYDDFGVIVGALIGYAGFAVAFLGARSIEI